MHKYDVKRYALILAIQAEIEGMKSENKHRELNGKSIAYGEDCFFLKANELRDLANKHDEQL